MVKYSMLMLNRERKWMKKLERIRNEFGQLGIQALLITSPYNRRYIANFTGTTGVVLITEEDAYFITDFRYIEQAKRQAVGYGIIQHSGSIPKEVVRICNEKGINKLGFEEDDVTYALYQAYVSEFKGTLVPVSGVIEKLRLIKTEEEIKIIKVACDIADAAFKHILEFIRPGITELDVSNELEFFMRKCGATSSSFDTIVASGLNSALPHGVASNKVIEKGDMVTLDYGAYYDGYVSDITRTVAVGDPGEQLKKIYDIVLQAQLKGMEEIRPGMTGKEADAITRDYITEHGHGDDFGHSTGHGIGLEIHEGPTLSKNSEVLLKSGMVVTCEPGIYVPGLGGVRIEDDLVITEHGNEALTHSTKELIIL